MVSLFNTCHKCSLNFSVKFQKIKLRHIVNNCSSLIFLVNINNNHRSNRKIRPTLTMVQGKLQNKTCGLVWSRLLFKEVEDVVSNAFNEKHAGELW